MNKYNDRTTQPKASALLNGMQTLTAFKKSSEEQVHCSPANIPHFLQAVTNLKPQNNTFILGTYSDNPCTQTPHSFLSPPTGQTGSHSLR
jgi:hypothetical protein